MKKDDIIERLVNTLLLADFDFNDFHLLRSTILLTLVKENLIKEGDNELLDFEIIFDEGDKNYIYIILKSKNLVTSLWFDGIFPEDPWGVHTSGKYKFNNRVYFFNKETGKLGYKQLKEKSKDE